ncbi:unnamed protein product [Owenia fusiformis]|uniref:Uncharacterized protein n=1 Tax=Owenia fusiformis TaxID=6347 RepID=A0A8J1U444_OWEFU|nr:unnamed protein product [Owenia fusiformis]
MPRGRVTTYCRGSSLNVALLGLILVFSLIEGAVVERTEWQLGTDQSVDLGSFPHVCLGNIHKCPHGFTVSLWYKPLYGDTNNAERYIVSNGGQSSLSEGFYLRLMHGKEFQIGTSVAGREWNIEFKLGFDEWTHLTLTWKSPDGLCLYVDGFRVACDIKGKDRFFVQYGDIDPFPRLVVGKASDKLRTSPGTVAIHIRDLMHVDVAMDQEQVMNITAPTDYLLGCTDDTPGDEVIIPNDEGALASCRTYCQPKNNTAVLRGSSCGCSDKKSISIHQECKENDWNVYATTHIVGDLDYAINLKVEVILPTDKGYTRPGETIQFNLITDTDEKTIYHVNFGDGVVKTTHDPKTSHTWDTEGTYIVTIKARNRKHQETKTIDVTITDVDENVRPRFAHISTSHSNVTRSQLVNIDAFSDSDFTCRFGFGDGNEIDFGTSESSLLSKVAYRRYSSPGVYQLDLGCRNSYGNTTQSLQTIARNYQTDYSNIAFGKSFKMSLRCSTTDINTLDIHLDGTTVNPAFYTIANGSLTIGPEAIKETGKHLVLVKSQATTILRHVFNIEEAISGINITTNPPYAEVGEDITLTFIVAKGDYMDIELDYGDGESEYVFFEKQSDPVVMTRTHSYSGLGYYEVSMRVFNSISEATTRHGVSIERPIESVVMVANNVTDLETPVNFIFSVDLHVNPSMPIQCRFDFDNGVSESVKIGEIKGESQDLVYSRMYEDYGIYTVRATIGNNISSIDVSQLIQVGENLTYIDIWAETERTSTDHPAELKIVYPYGSPVEFKVDLDDGQTLLLPQGILVNTSDDTSVRVKVEDEREPLTMLNKTTPTRHDIQRTSTSKPSGVTSTWVVLNINDTIATDANVPIIDLIDDIDVTTESVIIVNEDIDQIVTLDPIEESDDIRILPVDMDQSDSLPIIPANVTEGRDIIERNTGGFIGQKTSEQELRRKRRDLFNDGSGDGESSGEGSGNENPINVNIMFEDHIYTTLSPELIRHDDMPTAYDIPPKYQVVTVYHRYRNPGRYTVQVDARNKFSTAQSTLCPPIMVEHPNDDPACRNPIVAFRNIRTNRDQPIVQMRSLDLPIALQTVPMCGTSMPEYTWKVTRFIDDDFGNVIERPVNEVCTVESEDPIHVIPARSLEYGKYKVQVSVAQTDMPLKSTSKQLYVDMVKTPIVANVEGSGEVQTVAIFGNIDLDMTSSHDPDVSLGANDPLLKFDVFCFPEEKTELLESSRLIDLKEQAREIHNETVSLWDMGCFSSPPTPIFTEPGIIRFTAGSMSMQVYTFKLILSKDNRQADDSVSFRVLATNNTDDMLSNIDALLASGDTSGALMVIGMAANQIQAAGSGGNQSADDAKAARTQMRAKLLNALENVADNIDKPDQAAATASALEGITAAKDEVTAESKSSAGAALGKLGSSAKKFATEPMGTITNLAGAMLNTASNILPEQEPEPNSSKRRRRRRSLEEAEEENIEEQMVEICEVDYTITDITDDQEKTICDLCNEDEVSFLVDETSTVIMNYIEECLYSQPEVRIDKLLELKAARAKREEIARSLAKSTTENSVKATSDVSDVIVGKLDNNASMGLKSSSLELQVSKVSPNASEPAAMESDVGGFSMPGSELGSEDGEAPGAKFLASNNNIYNWDTETPAPESGVLSISFTYPNGTEMKKENMSEPIEMFINGKPDLVPEALNYTFTTYRTGPEKDKLKMNHHSVTLPRNGSSLHVIIYPMTEDDEYDVYMAYGIFPNETYFDYKTHIPSDEVFNTKDESKLDVLRHTVFAPSNLTALNGTYYIGIKLAATKVNFAEESWNHTYTFRTFTSGCRYWNEENQTWAGDGCMVGPITTIEKTQCLCTHLTNFGGDFVVPPNSIDFSTVFAKFAKLGENAAVFSVVISVLGLYFIALVWCRRKDKQDLIKWGAKPLEDNIPTDQYHYQMIVYTGIKRDADTKSKISFILSGDEGDTGVRRLFDGEKKHFTRGSIRNYVLSTDKCIGPMTFLRIWHDNSGRGKFKGWYCEQVQLVDLQTGDKYFFLCNRWLAVEEDDGQVERIVPVAGLEDLVDFKHLFGTSVRKKLSNDHLWVSVFSRPTRSGFTRAQRLSCCLSLLFLTMITNAMFFKSEEKVENKSALKLGPFSFTLSQLWVSLVSTFIVFPPNLILMTFFRKCKPRNNNIMQSNQRKTKMFKWKTLSKDKDSSLWAGSSIKLKQSKFTRFKDALHKIVTVHQQKKYEDDYNEKDAAAEIAGKKRKKKSFLFPWWCVYIAWAVCFLSCAGSAFFTILYSLEWGKEKAEEWLTTFLLSFFQNVIVVQPIKVFLLAAFLACILKKPDLGEDDETFDNNPLEEFSNDESKLNQSRIEELIQRRKMAAAEVKPPDTKALEKARQKRLNEMKMEAILKECVVYAVFLLVLFFLSYQAKSMAGFEYANVLKNQFVDTGSDLTGISRPDQFWSWCRKTLVPGLFAEKWYNDRRLTWRESIAMGDRETFRVGVARIRQARVKDDTCVIDKNFRSVIHHCRDSYSWTDDDTKAYLPGWKPPENFTDEQTEELEDREDTPWVYQNSVRLRNAPYMGTLHVYKGGGYVHNLGLTAERSHKVIDELEEKEWVDVNTRAVFVEFTVYNANVNLFASVILLVEFMSTGAAIPRSEIKVFRLYGFVGSWGVVVLFFNIVFLVFVTYFIYHMIKLLRKEKLKYFKDFWNFLEFGTLVSSIVAIAMYAMKTVMGNLAMSALLESGKKDYVNFVSIAAWDELYQAVVGIIVFFSTLKFIKMLQFNKNMCMLGDTVKLAVKDLKMFCITFFIYFFAFCLWGYTLFGTQLPNYGTFVGCIEALFAFSLGSFDFYEFRDANPFYGPIFFFLFVGIVYIGLMGMFLTIIGEAFSKVKEDSSLQSNDYEIVDFIWGRFIGLFGFSNKPAQKEPSEDPLQEPEE